HAVVARAPYPVIVLVELDGALEVGAYGGKGAVLPRGLLHENAGVGSHGEDLPAVLLDLGHLAGENPGPHILLDPRRTQEARDRIENRDGERANRRGEKSLQELSSGDRCAAHASEHSGILHPKDGPPVAPAVSRYITRTTYRRARHRVNLFQVYGGLVLSE